MCLRSAIFISCLLLLAYINFAQDTAKILSLRHDLLVAKDDTSKANALNDLGWQYHNTNTDIAMVYVKAALLAGEKAAAPKQVGLSKYYLGRLYYIKSVDDSAIKNFDEALVIENKLGNTGMLSTVHMYKGYVYLRSGRAVDGLNEYLASLKYAEQSGDKKRISDALYSIGDYYLHNERLRDPSITNVLKAQQYFLQALQIDKELNIESNIATDYQYLGSCNWRTKNFDEAKKDFNISLGMFKKLDDDFHVGLVYSYLGNLYNSMGVIDRGIENSQKAETIFEKLGSSLEAADVADNLSALYLKKKDYNSALHVAQQGLVLAKQANAVPQIFYLYTSLANVSAALKDFKNAYNYQLLATALMDTINQQEQHDKLDELQTKYESEKKDKAIKLLNTQAKLDKEQITRQHILELFSVVSIVLIVILSIVLINRSRIKQQLKEVNVRNQLAADLHDEVGSSLSSILLLSKMAAGKTGEENKSSMLEKISGNTKEVIDKMGDIVWMMNPKYDEGENLREKLEQYIARIKDMAAFRINLEMDTTIDAIKFPMEIRKTIFLVCKEAINNALKYAAATTVAVSLKLIDQHVQLSVIDDGKGFDVNTICSGNGLDTMALRTKNCKGNFSVTSVINSGTTITASIPIPHFR